MLPFALVEAIVLADNDKLPTPIDTRFVRTFDRATVTSPATPDELVTRI